MLLMSTFNLSEKIENGVSYQVREIFSPFCNLFALTLSSNIVKSLRVTKIVKETNFEVVRDKIGPKKCF